MAEVIAVMNKFNYDILTRETRELGRETRETHETSVIRRSRMDEPFRRRRLGDPSSGVSRMHGDLSLEKGGLVLPRVAPAPTANVIRMPTRREISRMDEREAR